MSSTKRRDIAAVLRARIRDGVYAPDARIPSQRELRHEFDVSPVTLQRAIDRLVDQGFLIPRGNAGTFVSPFPSHRFRGALVLPKGDEDKPLNRFWETLRSTAGTWTAEDGGRFDVHCIRNGEADHDRLCELVADDALAGLLFATTPYPFLGSPLLTAAVPRVAIGDEPSRIDVERLGTSFIHLQDSGLLERLFGGFAAEGRHRVAVLSDQRFIGSEALGMALARKAGLETRTSWWIGLPNIPEAATTARAAARLLCCARPADRPDCLLIADDNFVPAATAGIRDAGLRVPEDLIVAAHANFPQPVPAEVPCRRYGYDARDVLAVGWDEISRLRRGLPQRPLAVPIVFDA